MVPVAADAEALELLALGVDPMLGIGAAFGAEFLDRNLVLVELFLAILLLDLPLDWQAVAVPAGDVRRVLALQRLGAADHVLQDMVERMADVHVAIRVRRRSEEHTSELPSLMRISYAVSCLQKKSTSGIDIQEANTT